MRAIQRVEAAVLTKRCSHHLFRLLNTVMTLLYFDRSFTVIENISSNSVTLDIRDCKSRVKEGKRVRREQ
jgi:hypothetical protein